MAGADGGRYRVGWKLGETWEPWTAIPDWQPGEGSGLGADVADLDGDGRPELLVLDRGRRTIGWGLDETGHVAEGWGPWSAPPGGRAPRNTAAAFVCLIDGERPELMTLGGGAVATQPVEAGEDPAEAGAWRILDHSSQILAVHAALMHTGDVLWFAGSGADPDDHDAGRFRTRVWHYPSRNFSSPRTPIDLFCAGQTFLEGGRLLAAGGTARYTPFRGIRDALVFDPGDLRWIRVRRMLKPRWYPTLITLGDGRILSVSGRGASRELVLDPESFEAGEGWQQAAVARADPLVPAPVPARRRARLLLGRPDERQPRRAAAGLEPRERQDAGRAGPAAGEVPQPVGQRAARRRARPAGDDRRRRRRAAARPRRRRRGPAAHRHRQLRDRRPHRGRAALPPHGLAERAAHAPQRHAAARPHGARHAAAPGSRSTGSTRRCTPSSTTRGRGGGSSAPSRASRGSTTRPPCSCPTAASSPPAPTRAPRPTSCGSRSTRRRTCSAARGRSSRWPATASRTAAACRRRCRAPPTCARSTCCARAPPRTRSTTSSGCSGSSTASTPPTASRSPSRAAATSRRRAGTWCSRSPPTACRRTASFVRLG